MRLLADENISAPLVNAIREVGYDVLYIAETASGITDAEVLEMARVGHRLLLNEDKDFGELVFRLKRNIPGVIMLRLPVAQPNENKNRLLTILNKYTDKLPGNYTVVEQNRVRFRALHCE